MPTGLHYEKMKVRGAEGEISWARVIVVAVLAGGAVVALTVWLVADRMTDAQFVLMSACNTAASEAQAVACVQRALLLYLSDTGWMARVFVSVWGAAFGLGWLILRRASRPLSEAALAAGLGAGLIVMTLEPAGLPALGLSTGILLAGLMRQRRLYRKPVPAR